MQVGWRLFFAYVSILNRIKTLNPLFSSFLLIINLTVIGKLRKQKNKVDLVMTSSMVRKIGRVIMVQKIS